MYIALTNLEQLNLPNHSRQQPTGHYDLVDLACFLALFGEQVTFRKYCTVHVYHPLNFRDKYPIVGDVRGKGLMLGVEMVEDKNTRKPLSAQAMGQMWDDMKDLGILIGRGGHYGQVSEQ